MPEGQTATSNADRYSFGVESGRRTVRQVHALGPTAADSALINLLEDLDDAERAVLYARGQVAGARAELAQIREGGEDAPRADPGACGEDAAAKTVGRGLTSQAVPGPADGTATPAPPPSHLPARRVLLEAFLDTEPCWFDHHGHCQGHGFTLDPGERCPQVELKQMLEQPPRPTTDARASRLIGEQERADRIETAAQIVHARRHKLGTAPVCGECRNVARQIVDALDPAVPGA